MINCCSKRRYAIKPSAIQGAIEIPPSKSQTLRAVLFGALGKGKTTIYNHLHSPDTQAMVDACRLFGAKIIVLKERIEIEGVNGFIPYAEDVINAQNSGIVLRFCSAIGSLSSNPIVITGDHSIRKLRPMSPLLEGLAQLGVAVSTLRGDGFAPVILKGPLRPGRAYISGEDSQPVSALLIASAFTDGSTEICVRNPGEKPWVGLTLDWFDRLGIAYKNENFSNYFIQGNTRYNGFSYHVPGDFSSAAFPIAAALITNGEILLHNVDFNDPQGDKKLIDVFRRMGANIEIDPEKKTLRVLKGKQLQGIQIDINDFIDSITILAVVACFAKGETKIYNAASARNKECNRILCIANELRKMGASIQETEDGLIIQESRLKGTAVKSYEDHRMAMSLAIAGFSAKNETIVESIACVAKTFPNFVSSFESLGAHIKLS